MGFEIELAGLLEYSSHLLDVLGIHAIVILWNSSIVQSELVTILVSDDSLYRFNVLAMAA